jgi:hypothetical protein
MKPKQLILLLVLCLVLGALGLYVRHQQQGAFHDSSINMGQKLLGDFDPNTVAELRITSGSNVLSVSKKNDTWVVKQRNDYPAGFSTVSDLLQKLWQMKIAEPVKVGPSRLPALDLVPPPKGAGTLLELLGSSGQPIRTIVLGKEHRRSGGVNSSFDGGGWPDGRYVMAGNDSKNAALVADTLSNIEPKPDQWLNKDFFKVEKARAISADFAVATNSWKVTRDTESGEWKLADARPGEQLDSTKTSSLSNPLNSPSFVDVSTASPPPVLDKPTTITLETFDNFTYTVKVGQKTNDDYPLTLAVAAQIPTERTAGKDEKPEDKTKLDKEFKDKQTKLEDKLKQEKACENWVYLVSSWTMDPLLKERSQLLVEKKEEAKKDEKPAAVEATKKEVPAATETNKIGGE